MPLGPKLAPLQVSTGTWPAFNRYLHVSFKQNSGERFRATWPSCFKKKIRKFFQEHYQNVKQFRSRSGPTFCQGFLSRLSVCHLARKELSISTVSCIYFIGMNSYQNVSLYNSRCFSHYLSEKKLFHLILYLEIYAILFSYPFSAQWNFS